MGQNHWNTLLNWASIDTNINRCKKFLFLLFQAYIADFMNDPQFKNRNLLSRKRRRKIIVLINFVMYASKCIYSDLGQ